MAEVTSGPRSVPKPCRHDSERVDGTLDCNCLRCGADGYWHDGHRHDVDHPSGKVLVRLFCPDDNYEDERASPRQDADRKDDDG